MDGTTSQKREKEDCVPYFPTKALIYRFSPSPTRFLYRGYLSLRGKSSWEAEERIRMIFSTEAARNTNIWFAVQVFSSVRVHGTHESIKSIKLCLFKKQHRKMYFVRILLATQVIFGQGKVKRPLGRSRTNRRRKEVKGGWRSPIIPICGPN